jgi:hypothetical protein
LHGAKIPIGKSGKITFVSGSGCTRACYRHFLFPVPNCHTEFLAFLRSSPPFFSFICSEQGEPEVLLKVLTLGEELVGARQRMSHTHHKQNGTAEARGLVPLGGGELARCFHLRTSSLISPTHKRTEGRAPVWGSEFTSKRRRTTGGIQQKPLLG